MNWYEILSLIISLLSLLATIAISFVIYFLEKKNVIRQKLERIKHEAKIFLLENAEERDYLHWAVVAAGCFPQNKHIRKIYNNFSLLEDDVKKEVLKQANINVNLISGNEWIDKKIEILKSNAKKLGLGDPFLYDSAKHFHRLYDDKERNYYEIFNSTYWALNYKDVFGLDRLNLYKVKGMIPFTRYLDDYLYFKFEKPEKFSDEWVKPFDYLIEVENLRSISDEGYVCFWVSHFVDELLCYSEKYLGFNETNHVQTDAVANTFEDRYFEVLYELFFFNIDN